MTDKQTDGRTDTLNIDPMTEGQTESAWRDRHSCLILDLTQYASANTINIMQISLTKF